MLSRFLPPFLRGILAISLHALILFVLSIMVFILAMIKYAIPLKTWHVTLDRLLNYLPVLWTDANDFTMRLLTKLAVDYRGPEHFIPRAWYLMTANHRSWTDVLVLYRIFNHRLPVLKFFMKSQLLYVPFLGWACWLIGYPFMKRYTKDEIAKNPLLKGKDLETTKKMCRRFKNMPMTIITFAEGTRYTKEKAKRQNTPHRHLLKPKAGGLAYTIASMDGLLTEFIDVTIVYSDHCGSFWNYLTGRLKKVTVNVEVHPIEEALSGNYINDRDHRVQFQTWLNNLWNKKDALIEDLLKE